MIRLRSALLFATISTIAFTSCAKSDTKEDEDKAKSVEANDTMSAAYGKVTGHFVGNELRQYAEQTGVPYDTDEFIAGVEAVLSGKQSEAYLAGMNTGLHLAAELNQFEQGGEIMSRPTVMANFRLGVAGNIDEAEIGRLQKTVTEFSDQMMDNRRKAEEDAKAASPEAIQNIKTGEALVAKAIKDEPDAKTSPSGLVYIIREPGTEPKVKATDKVEVKYAGSHLDGKVFDANTATFSPSQVIAGFGEGLQLLGKGGKARFYIPGKLGYGANGAPGANIGPMETLVFDVEIIDIK